MYKKLVLKGEIDKFDEAIPIGNGRLGALIYKGNPLRVSVDRNDVWDLRTPEFRTRENFNIERQMELIANNGYQELRKYFNASGLTYPTKLPVNKFQLFFDGDKKIVKNSVDLTNGLAKFEYEDGLEVESFISLAGETGYIRANQPYRVEFDVLVKAKTKETDRLSYSIIGSAFL